MFALARLSRLARPFARKSTHNLRHQQLYNRSFFSPSKRPLGMDLSREGVLDLFFGRRLYSTGWGGHDSRPAKTATWLVIGLSTAVSGVWYYAGAKNDRRLQHQLYEHTMLSEGNLRAGRYWTLITNAFTHRDSQHYLFNMISFYTFGSVAAMVPGVGFLHIIGVSIGSGLFGSIAWLYQDQHKHGAKTTRDPRRGINARQGRTVVTMANGASGMVMGVGAMAACLIPTAPMNFMFIPIAIPLWVATLGYVAVDLFYLDANDRIGHSAHLGGAAFGAVYYLSYLRNRDGAWNILTRIVRRR